jgi:hypothetical protein
MDCRIGVGQKAARKWNMNTPLRISPCCVMVSQLGHIITLPSYKS